MTDLLKEVVEICQPEVKYTVRFDLNDTLGCPRRTSLATTSTNNVSADSIDGCHDDIIEIDQEERLNCG